MGSLTVIVMSQLGALIHFSCKFSITLPLWCNSTLKISFTWTSRCFHVCVMAYLDWFDLKSRVLMKKSDATVCLQRACPWIELLAEHTSYFIRWSPAGCRAKILSAWWNFLVCIPVRLVGFSLGSLWNSRTKILVRLSSWLHLKLFRCSKIIRKASSLNTHLQKISMLAFFKCFET